MNTRVIRRIFVVTCFVLVAGLVWAAIYARKQGFTQSWRMAIEEEMAAQGYHVSIGKLTLGAFRGLVAEDVKFFHDENKTRAFAEMNDIYLDVGLERILQKRISVNTLDIKDGRLTVPLEPGPGGAKRNLQVTELSSRIVLTDGRLRIVKLDAMLATIRISMKGSLLRPPRNNRDQLDAMRKQALDATFSGLDVFKKAVDVLSEFQFPGEAPTLNVVFQGDLQDLRTTTARATFLAENFRRRGVSHEVVSFECLAEFDGRTKQLSIPRMVLVDRVGQLSGEGKWNKESNTLDFDVTSTADIQKLARYFTDNQKLGELAFDRAPSLKLEGSLDFGKLNDEKPGLFPGQILGEIETDGFFTSGGLYFGSSRADFSFRDDQFYIRNLQIYHKSGGAFLNAKYQPDLGSKAFQFQCEVKMDPRNFSPFLRDPGTRRFLTNWSFNDNSGVYLAASGQSSSYSDFSDIQARGVIDLRDFRLNRIEFQELEADFEVSGAERWYRNVRLTRGDGEIVASLAYTDSNKRIWQIKGGESSVNPVETFGAFSPRLRELLVPYRFSSTPSLHVQGMVDARTPEELGGEKRLTDLSVKFSSTGPAYYSLFGKEVPFDSPDGEFYIKGEHGSLRDLKAGLCGGTVTIDFESPGFFNGDRRFSASVKMEEVGLRSLGKIYGFENNAIGHIAGSLNLAGEERTLDEVIGKGEMSIANRDLFELPQLKGLKEMVSVSETDEGRSSMNFDVNRGVYTSREIQLFPGKSDSLSGKGKADLLRDSFTMTITPDSESADYHFKATGPVAKPVWDKVDGRPAEDALSGL